MEIRFVNHIRDQAGHEANAKYEDGRITVALDAEDPVMTSVLHEAVHRIRESAPDAYTELADYVRSTLTPEELHGNLGVRSELYGTSDVDFLTEEVVADAFGRVVRGESLDPFVREHRNLAQRILDTVRDIIRSVKRALGGKNTQLTDNQKASFQSLYGQLHDMEQKFQDAIERAGEKRTGGLQGQNTKGAAHTGGGTKFSINGGSTGNCRNGLKRGSRPENSLHLAARGRSCRASAPLKATFT